MILTDDEKLAEKAHYLTTQAKDDPVRYIHDEIGYNFRLTEIQAAIARSQLVKLDNLNLLVCGSGSELINRLIGACALQGPHQLAQ